MEKRVPQGSVLGPILWIIGYDAVLHCPISPDSGMVCYADDTLVLVGGRWWHETLRHGEPAAACVIRAIRRLGLKVSPAKSEAIWLYDYRRRGAPPPDQCLDISGEEVKAGPRMKYSGLTIHSQWTFGSHFKLLIPKVATTANALCGLLPNVGEAEVGVRRLYEGVIRSQVPYGAPLWTKDLMKSRRSLLLLRSLHRTTTIRIVRGYHMGDIICVGDCPGDVSSVRAPGPSASTGVPSTAGPVLRRGYALCGPVGPRRPVGGKARDLERWRSQLAVEDTVRPHRAVEAVLPNWEACRDRGGHPLTYRMTQVLTGHEAFGEFLLRIR